MLANYHVLFVHFPAALLPLYAIMEVIRFKRVTEKPYWFYVKAMFAIIGMISAHVASALGGTIEETIGDLHPELKPLIEAHSGMAALSTLVFTVLGLAYAVAWLHIENPSLFMKNGISGKLWHFALSFQRVVLKNYVSIVLALIGLFAITATGALGGAIVYSPEVDPFVTFFYALLVH